MKKTILKHKKNINQKKLAETPSFQKSSIYDYISFLCVNVLSFTIFLCRYGWEIVNPYNAGWLLHRRFGDTISQYLVWRFFRNEPWSFPLGTIKGYLYPYGTTVGYSDCIPLFAFISKIVSIFIHQEFQYFGLWMLFCYMLNGIFAWLLMTTITKKHVLQILGALFFIVSPVLLARDHFALNAHWLILASLFIYFSDYAKKNVLMIFQIVITFLSLLIHPYLFGMSAGISFVYGIKLYRYEKVIKFSRFLVYLFMLFIVSYITAYMIGFVSSEKQKGSWGYGYYSMNLNALVNAKGPENSEKTSSFFEGMQRMDGQYEGYSYMGLGMLMLLLIAMYLYFFVKNIDKKKLRSISPLIFLSIIYVLFALSNVITLNKKILFQYNLNDSFYSIASLFRCSGRFFWVPYYLIMYFVLYVLFNKIKSYKKIIFITVFALIVQIYDLYPLITNIDKTCTWFDLDENLWNKALHGYKKIVVFPPYTKNIKNNDDYMNFLYFAGTNKMMINTGYMLRPLNISKEYVNQTAYEIYSGQADKNSVYIITEEYAYKFYSSLNQYFNCYLIEGYIVCYVKNSVENKDLLKYKILLSSSGFKNKK